MKTIYYIALSLLFMSCGKTGNVYKVSNEAMSPSLNIGDHIFVNTMSNSYTYGDIIVYKYPGSDSTYMQADTYVHRIVGLPGDSIAMENGICIINGKKNRSRFLGKRASGSEYIPSFDVYEEIFPNEEKIRILCIPENPHENLKSIYIPEGHYYILGDSRGNSADSRAIGFVPKEWISGKVVKIISPD